MDVSTGEVEDKKYRIKDTDTKDFWLPILKAESFRKFIEEKYRVAAGEIIKEELGVEDESV